MLKVTFRTLVLSLAFAGCSATASDRVVVIGNANLRSIDQMMVAKVFTGRVVEIGGVPVVAVNAASGSVIRSRFLRTFLGQNEEKYNAYWTVRRYIGKGIPPRELTQVAEVIEFVNVTPGAIAYIDEADVQPGMNVLLK